MSHSRSILFLDKVLTKPLKESRLRGVELFNLLFIRDLIELDREVTLLIHPTWRPVVEEELPAECGAGLTVWETSLAGGKHLGSLFPLWKRRKDHFDALFLANVGDGILIPYFFIQKTHMAEKTVLLAHKVPGRLFVTALEKDTSVVSVNRTISRPFEAGGFPLTEVYYGIHDSTQFFPPTAKRKDDKIRFGMLGDLDSEWKGSDTAIEAFLHLPSDLADCCELHLAAYRQKNPKVSDPRISIYEWIDREKVGDYLRSLDVMLTLSRDLGCMMETFCQTMVQGMLCGLPQITTNLEIFSEKLVKGGGIVTDSKAELVEAMIKLARAESLRRTLGDQAVEIAKSDYVWDPQYFAGKYL